MTESPLRTDAETVETAGGGDTPVPPAVGAPETRPEARSPADDERLLRALADLDNMRKRFQREVLREREAERFRVAREWLPIVDDLDRALEHAPGQVEVGDGVEPGGVTEGVRAVRDHALAVLARLGYERFGSVGDAFDPGRYEAVGAIDADAAPGTVLAVVRPGYGTPEVILRPAAVVVARAAA